MTRELAAGTSTEQPTFWVAFVGFGARQRTLMESEIARAGAMPQWRIGSVREADAWFVDGGRCRIVAGGHLRVAPGVPNELSVNVDVGNVERPMAFSVPLASPGLEPRYRFDPDSAGGVQSMLLHFDAWFRFARAQFALGRQVVELGSRLRHGIFHVSHRGRLLAVLDFRRGQAGLAPQLQAGELRDAEWASRPDSAGDIPERFVACSTAQLAWNYVRRTERDMLPPRYREQAIHYRGAPRVPLNLLRDSQLALLKELHSESAMVGELAQRTGLAEHHVERDLACLYYASAITTTASKAAHRPVRGADDSQSSSVLQSRVPAEGQEPAPYRADLTVPASLKPGVRREPA